MFRLLLFLSLTLSPTGFLAADAEEQKSSRVSLSEGLRPFVEMVSGNWTSFRLSGDLQIKIDGRPQPIQLELTRSGNDAFDLSLTHADYAIRIHRRSALTAIVLPLHQTAYVGTGTVSENSNLSPTGILSRLVSPDSDAASALSLINIIQPESIDAMIPILSTLVKTERAANGTDWVLTENSPVSFPSMGAVQVKDHFGEVLLTVTKKVEGDLPEIQIPSSFRSVAISRQELETTLSRGLFRASEILLPGQQLRNPPRDARDVDNGELKWIQGQRVALLSGTPEQIGRAHGELLPDESRRCIESVLYTFATAHVIRTGNWFRHDLEAAFERLKPHIPKRHQREIAALADALGLPEATLQTLNVFPEMFHCSGFAVFGSATADGRLYHGRVLDYMTTIGLQDAATTFIVQPKDHFGFANVGYAAFTGSVSGMNDQAISLGEMGGRGEGDWDGVPMATLMRRALEECSTLDEVKALWANSPRTCEYYYVFADGKTNDAVGVAALPDSIEFVRPGEGHERLGQGIPDTVYLSAGSRLERLRNRIQEKHGKIDVATSLWLMSRPVAMQSNLHNVLFIPEAGVLHVANASHSRPAAEMPYVELNLSKLLEEARQLQAR